MEDTREEDDVERKLEVRRDSVGFLASDREKEVKRDSVSFLASNETGVEVGREDEGTGMDLKPEVRAD